jgi:protein-tyrosine-phosphatase
VTTILFLCPHSAAKSVLAAAYCQQVAKAQGLQLKVDFAGTHPDETIAPAVVEFLKGQNLETPHPPRCVTRYDIATASTLVSLGCDLNDLPLQGKEVERWDDVPPVSQDFEKAWLEIKKKVETLIAQLP